MCTSVLGILSKSEGSTGTTQESRDVRSLPKDSEWSQSSLAHRSTALVPLTFSEPHNGVPF